MLMLSILYARFILFIFLPLVALSAVAIYTGEAHPTHPALRGMVEGCEDIPQPCWYGITPNQTRVDEALARVELLGVTPEEIVSETSRQYRFAVDGCVFRLNVFSEATNVSSITADECHHLRWGDLIAMFGEPVSIRMMGTDCRYYYVYGFAFVLPIPLPDALDNFPSLWLSMDGFMITGTDLSARSLHPAQSLAKVTPQPLSMCDSPSG